MKWLTCHHLHDASSSIYYEEDWRPVYYDSFVKLESKLNFSEFLTSKWRFWYKSGPDSVPLLSVSLSGGDTMIRVTYIIDFSTLTKDID